MKQLTREEAIAFADSKKWESMTQFDRLVFQLVQDRLCMPIGVLMQDLNEQLGRSVFTHELIDKKRLMEELMGERDPATWADILAPLEGLDVIIATPNSVMSP